MSLILAYFVTPHGFGHAARACAVIEALTARCRDVRVELFTTTPRWFFEESLTAPFGYHFCPCDLGLVQTTSLEEDLVATARRLQEEFPFAPKMVDELASAVRDMDCRGVLCDVAALGVLVAQRAGLPSVVVENFTWDWIYAAYADHHHSFAQASRYTAAVIDGATLHIQTEPVCAPRAAAQKVPTVWRQPRRGANETRRRLGVEVGQRLVLLTMGGVAWRWRRLDRLADYPDAAFVVPGAAEEARRHGNVVLLPHRTGFYHPDLVQAADLVVGKLGYSTVAEVVGMGKPFLYVPRPTFPESPVLETFLQRRGGCRALAGEHCAALEWGEEVTAMVGTLPELTGASNGAPMVAQAALDLFLNQ